MRSEARDEDDQRVTHDLQELAGLHDVLCERRKVERWRGSQRVGFERRHGEEMEAVGRSRERGVRRGRAAKSEERSEHHPAVRVGRDTITGYLRHVKAYRCSLTTMRSCVGSMVRSAIWKGNLLDLSGIGGSSRSGSAEDGRGIRRIEVG